MCAGQSYVASIMFVLWLNSSPRVHTATKNYSARKGAFPDNQ